MNIFNDGIKSLQEIPQVEQKLLTDLFRSNTKMYLKACVKPTTKPMDADPEDPTKMPDPNAWVYEAYMRLSETIAKIIEPLDKYFLTFEKYQKENDTLDPEKVLKELDEMDPTDWPDVSELQGRIKGHLANIKRLSEEIPEEKTVSVFKISTFVIRDLLCAKHKKLADGLIEVIAKITKRASNELLNNFNNHNIKVEGTPKGIEELDDLKTFMNSIPSLIQKEQAEIKKVMKNYEALDEFGYKWDDEDEYDKMWRVYGAPLETVERVAK